MSPFFHITFKGQRFDCVVASADVSLRYDFESHRPAFLDVAVNAQSVAATQDDGSTYTYDMPNFYLDSFALPETMPRLGDIRALERTYEFHQTRAADGQVVFEHDEPGALYFNHHQQIDDLVFDLHYLGGARFHVRAEGSVEMETTFRLEAEAPLSKITCSLADAEVNDLELVSFDDAAFDDAKARNMAGLPVAAIPKRLVADFATRFRVDQFDLALRQNAYHKGWTFFAVPRSDFEE